MSQNGGEQHVRVALITQTGAVIVAVVGVIGVLGGALLSARSPGVATALGAQPSVSISPSPVSSPSPSPSPVAVGGDDGGADGSGAVGSGAAGVLHEGTITVPVQQRFDLDSFPDDPQWGMLQSRGAWDMVWSSGDCPGLCVNNGSSVSNLIAPSNADFSTCATTTGYVSKHVSPARIKDGLTLCVKTSESHFAVVKVSRYVSMSQPIELSLKTYETPS